MKRARTFGPLFGLGTTALLVLLWPGAPALAATAATGHYADWSTAGSSGAHTGTGATGAAGFPDARVTSDATTVQVPSGSSAFIGPATPPSGVYGSSRDRTYLNVSTAKGITTSTTTLDFDSPTPAANWAFVLGDVDADQVEISGTDAGGNPLSAADLGFAGVFNYCAVSPKPSSCAGPGPFTDVPSWHPGSSLLVGNGADTSGSSGWFQPTVAVKSLTFKFTALVGFPIYQLWLTTLAVPVETTIAGITPEDPVPNPGVTVDLLESNGTTPVRDAAGKPVDAVADKSGKVVFPAVADGDYVLAIKVPSSVHLTGKTKIKITVDVTKGPLIVPKGTFSLVVPPQLAMTGSAAAPAAVLGLLLVSVGLLVVRLTRRSAAPER